VPPIKKLPSPVLAGFLSIIPGVGQVYNGQYAKGIVILLICAVLNSLGKTNHLEIFGIVAFGWWVYQIVDAYQTAKARVEGRPLPNPFELNDIGEKLGFGKGFGTSADMRAAAYGAAPITPPPPAAAPTPAPTPVSNWADYYPAAGASPAAGAVQPQAASAAYTAPVPPTPYSTTPYSTGPYSAAQPPYAPVPNVPVPPIPTPGSSFPLVAIWLIGLGVLFALAEWVPMWHINSSTLAAIVLGAVAASIIVRRMGYMGGMNLHEPILHMMRGPVILAVLAVMFLLQGVHAATIGQTWPVLFVALGAVLLGERLGMGAQPYPQSDVAGPTSVVPPAPTVATPEAATTSTTSTEAQHNDERDGYSR
jgi:hypothetical protein